MCVRVCVCACLCVCVFVFVCVGVCMLNISNGLLNLSVAFLYVKHSTCIFISDLASWLQYDCPILYAVLMCFECQTPKRHISTSLACIPPCIQGLLMEAEKTPNVVKATNRPRLFDELEDIQRRCVPYI